MGSFASVALPAPVNSLTALECVNAMRCWAVGSTVGVGGAPNGAAIITTADGGVRWSTQVIPPTVGYLSAIACSDPRHCTAVGQAGQTSDGQSVVIATSDAGGSWTQAQTPPGIVDVTAVSCQPDRRCLAIGSTAAGGVALVSTSAGSTWTMQGALPSNITGANDISCSNDQTCWVTAQTVLNPDHVSGAIAVTTDGGVLVGDRGHTQRRRDPQRRLLPGRLSDRRRCTAHHLDSADDHRRAVSPHLRRQRRPRRPRRPRRSPSATPTTARGRRRRDQLRGGGDHGYLARSPDGPARESSSPPTMAVPPGPTRRSPPRPP